MLCMETILKIRRLFYKEGLSQRKIADKLHLSRRTVKKYLTVTEPPHYQGFFVGEYLRSQGGFYFFFFSSVKISI